MRVFGWEWLGVVCALVLWLEVLVVSVVRALDGGALQVLSVGLLNGSMHNGSMLLTRGRRGGEVVVKRQRGMEQGAGAGAVLWLVSEPGEIRVPL